MKYKLTVEIEVDGDIENPSEYIENAVRNQFSANKNRNPGFTNMLKSIKVTLPKKRMRKKATKKKP